MRHADDHSALRGSLPYPPEREQCLLEAPPVTHYCENLLVTGYDPQANVGFWTHLGTHHDDFSLWEEQLFFCLPGDEGLLWNIGYGRPAPEQRPAGPTLSYRCIEPYRRWEVHFDGIGQRVSYEHMLRAPAPDNRREHFALDLTLEMVGPVWDAHDSATAPTGAGSMREQSWASEHYEQLYRFHGALRLEGGRTIPLRGTGLRDHSRGVRGPASLARFGGHALVGALYDSGKAFGLQRILGPDGSISMDTGYVVVDGTFHHAEVLEIPVLRDELHVRDEPLRVRLRSALGEHVIEGRLQTASMTTSHMPGMSVGADLTLARPFLFSQGHAAWTWEEEVAYGLTERSRYVEPHHRRTTP
jgi:hypothetical protein